MRVGSVTAFTVSLWACAQAESLKKQPPKLVDVPRNASLVFNLHHQHWMSGVSIVSEALGGNVAAAVFFAHESHSKIFGYLTGTLSKMLGNERPVFIGAVLDSKVRTIGDEEISLPHVLLVMPPRTTSSQVVRSGGVLKDKLIQTWNDWRPEEQSNDGRIRAARRLYEFVDSRLSAPVASRSALLRAVLIVLRPPTASPASDDVRAIPSGR